MLNCKFASEVMLERVMLMDNRHGTGYDYIRNDADGRNMRLDVRSQLK